MVDARWVWSISAGMLSVVAALMPGAATAAESTAGRTVRVVTPEAGGGLDLAARTVVQALAADQGRTFVIDNRGGGVIGPEIVAKAPPDGNTWLFYGNTVWLLPLMRTRMNYDPYKDLVPVSLGVMFPLLLVVHPSLPVSSVKELVALAKAKPGQLNFASASPGTGNHLAAELFKYMAGINIVRISYKGGAPALVSNMTGETQIFFPAVAPGLQAAKSGKVKVLGVTSAKPSALAPGLPTVAASGGLPGYESVYRAGIFLPAGTPPAIVNQVSRDFARVLQRPDIKEKLLTTGVETVGSTPEEFAAAIKSEVTVMGKVIKEAGIRED